MTSFGQAWLTTGPAGGGREMSPAQAYAEVAAQADRLDKAALDIGRDPADLDRILLSGFTRDDELSSVDAFVDFAGRYAQLGFTEIVMHWPVPDSVFDTDRPSSNGSSVRPRHRWPQWHRDDQWYLRPTTGRDRPECQR